MLKTDFWKWNVLNAKHMFSKNRYKKCLELLKTKEIKEIDKMTVFMSINPPFTPPPFPLLPSLLLPSPYLLFRVIRSTINFFPWTLFTDLLRFILRQFCLTDIWWKKVPKQQISSYKNFCYAFRPGFWISF